MNGHHNARRPFVNLNWRRWVDSAAGMGRRLARGDWLPGACLLCAAPVQGAVDLCAGCAAELPTPRVACPRCALPMLDAPVCGACASADWPMTRCVALANYAPPVDRLVNAFKHRAGLAIEITIDTRTGCVVSGDLPIIAETVTEARKVIASYAKGLIGDRQREPDKQAFLRFRTSRGRSAWKSLLECETHRRYDPADPGAPMTCSYLLYEEGNLEGVGGIMWTYGVEISVTGPPEVWDHPADQPVGLDDDNS